jgi:hypothetical protein
VTTSLSSSWVHVLRAHGLRALPHSRFVPVDAWLVDLRSPSLVLRLLARGTTVRLAAYERDDVTTLLLRAECDCEEHRLAGAAARAALRPAARPLTDAAYDGAARAGWTGVAAGLLRPDDVAPVLELLWRQLQEQLQEQLDHDAPLPARTA